MSTRSVSALAVLTAAGLLACSEGTGPGNKTQISFNVATSAGPAANLQSVSDTVVGGPNTLVLDQVGLVLRDIRFKRLNDDVCEGDSEQSGDIAVRPMSHDGGENGDDGNQDACETVNAGPFLLDLPLGSGVEKIFSVAVDTGTFDELRIRLHKPEDDGTDPADVAFLAAHPDFASISIRATGTWNGSPFTFTSDLDADQEMRLDPPLVVTDAGANVDVTLKVDVATWFADGAGGLVDPATAGQSGQNENLVRDNIQQSFDAFQDEDHDGHDDGGSDD
ncbi:MAG TPA: hypothetical protein VLA89_18970 [Gemmatimonadales bacterium]|nr:hypothetical protein [Gemmatimonadales bacterium]